MAKELTEAEKEVLRQRVKAASQILVNKLGVSNLEKIANHLDNNPSSVNQLLAYIKFKM